MQPILIFIYTCIIAPKIIHIESTREIYDKTYNIYASAGYRYKLNLWSRIMRQAAQGLTESASFVPIIQNIWEYRSSKQTDSTEYINFLITSLSNYLSINLDIDLSQILQTREEFTHYFQAFITESYVENQTTVYHCTANKIKKWHERNSTKNYLQFRTLLICEEILYQMMFCLQGYSSILDNTDQIVNDKQFYDKLEKYLQKDSKDLWELSIKDTNIINVPFSFLDILINNDQAKLFFETLSEYVQNDDTIVCFVNEYTLFRDLKAIVLGRIGYDNFVSCSEPFLDLAIEKLDGQLYWMNCVELNEKIQCKQHKFELIIKERYFINDEIVYFNEELLGNADEQKKWCILNDKLRNMFNLAFLDQ